jgi:hypothetical protein
MSCSPKTTPFPSQPTTVASCSALSFDSAARLQCTLSSLALPLPLLVTMDPGPNPYHSSNPGDSLNLTKIVEPRRPTMERVSNLRVTCCAVYACANIYYGCSSSHSGLDVNRVNPTNTALNPVNAPPMPVRFLKETKKEGPFTGTQIEGGARPGTCGDKV